MKRRQVLIFGAAATAALVPLSVVAVQPTVDFSLPVFDKIAELDHALDALQTFGLTQPEQAMALGFEPYAPFMGHHTPDGLRSLTYKFALDYGSRDLWHRVRCVARIKRGLDERFGDNAHRLERIVWVRRPNETFPITPLSELMVSGYGQIDWAARTISPLG